MVRIFKNAWFGRFARKENIDDSLLCEAVQRAIKGQIDAHLGGCVIKQRVARAGQGKSRGYRTIILFREGDKAFFVYGFAKGEKANISRNETEQFKKMASHVLGLSNTQLQKLVAKGHFEEVKTDAQEIPE